ncbi:MAG: hypothetical protein HUU46_18700 [Candidatus Hydrogenedentes bacterium]|nr:hypothetical protein [Candidatus Hydrogenedentota bacterium]
MIWAISSLAILSIGIALPLCLSRVPRIALVVSMSALFIGGLLLLAASVPVLLRAGDVAPTHIAWSVPMGHVSLSLDGLSAWFLMTIGLLAVCTAPYSVAYMRPYVGREPVERFGALLCMLVASLIVFVCAFDVVVFLIGWELMTLSAFLLVIFHDERPDVRRGAWMYLIATHLATGLCLAPLLALVYGATGTTGFDTIAQTLRGTDRNFLIAIFLLGVFGFGAKAGFFPLHIWLPAAHPVAPTPVSAFLSGVVVKMGIYGLLRLLTWLPPLPTACAGILLAVGIVSGVLGVLYALAQHDLKRLLAYHTIENIGIIAIAISMGMLGQAVNAPAVAALGYGGALLHVTNHALFKGLLFLSAGAVHHGTGTLAIERLGGLAHKTPVNALLFLAGAVAICGLPPLNGFVGEWVIYAGLVTGAQQSIGVSGGLPAVGVFSLALMGSLALACFAKVFGVVFLGAPRDPALSAHATPFAMKAAMAMPAIACACIGLAPGLWIPLTYSATSSLVGTDIEHVRHAYGSVLSWGTRLSWMAAVFLCVCTALALARRIASTTRSRAETPSRVTTWGCGYGYPTARMQYSATSFALPLIRGFRGLLWPEFRYAAPCGPFPGASHAETHVPDFAEHDVFAPLFRGIARASAMWRHFTWSGAPAAGTRASAAHERLGPLRTVVTNTVVALRRGAIQVYLLFIVITLILLFALEGLVFHRARISPGPTAPDSTVTTGQTQ